jgi:putative glycosyltransferase
MTRQFVQNLLLHREHRFSIEGLWEITGHRQHAVPVEKVMYKGQSTYSFPKKIFYLLNSITAFSNKPLVYIVFLGLLLIIPSGTYILYILFQHFFWGVDVKGLPSIISSIWLLGGLNIFILGIISIYLSIVFIEIKQRPYTIVTDIYGHLPDPIGFNKGRTNYHEQQ